MTDSPEIRGVPVVGVAEADVWTHPDPKLARAQNAMKRQLEARGFAVHVADPLPLATTKKTPGED
jgi:hypothetical protein